MVRPSISEHVPVAIHSIEAFTPELRLRAATDLAGLIRSIVDYVPSDPRESEEYSFKCGSWSGLPAEVGDPEKAAAYLETAIQETQAGRATTYVIMRTSEIRHDPSPLTHVDELSVLGFARRSRESSDREALKLFLPPKRIGRAAFPITAAWVARSLALESAAPQLIATIPRLADTWEHDPFAHSASGYYKEQAEATDDIHYIAIPQDLRAEEARKVRPT